MVKQRQHTESEHKPVPLHTARKPPQNSHRMQASEKQGARTKIPNKDSPRHFIVSNDNGTYDTVKVNQDDYHTLTRGRPSTRTATRRSYAGTITGITFFPEQNRQSTTQSSPSTEDYESAKKKKIHWTPKQFYDDKGNPDYQMNSDGIVLTSPSGHPFCSYCRSVVVGVRK